MLFVVKRNGKYINANKKFVKNINNAFIYDQEKEAVKDMVAFRGFVIKIEVVELKLQ